MHLAPEKFPDGEINEWSDVMNDGHLDELSRLKELWQDRLSRSKTKLRAVKCLRMILQIERLASDNHNQIV